MIFEVIVGVIVDVVVAVFGEKVVVPPVPGFVSTGVGAVSMILGKAVALGNWVPLELFAPVVIAVVACLAGGFAIKVIRIVLSFVTLGGGAAG